MASSSTTFTSTNTTQEVFQALRVVRVVGPEKVLSDAKATASKVAVYRPAFPFSCIDLAGLSPTTGGVAAPAVGATQRK